ncbi:MAG: helix-turn-helix transcriptional regulator [Anderseniella sp.]|nr:helix-turn-helix transcriptional regulator [Anderseniella sp.]
MNLVTAAQGFSAMGSESRLEVLQSLVRAGDKGLLVGDIQQRTGIPGSTLAHHLKFLTSADLIVQNKHGRTIVNQANYQHLQALAAFILEECCTDQEIEA